MTKEQIKKIQIAFEKEAKFLVVKEGEEANRRGYAAFVTSGVLKVILEEPDADTEVVNILNAIIVIL